MPRTRIRFSIFYHPVGVLSCGLFSPRKNEIFVGDAPRTQVLILLCHCERTHGNPVYLSTLSLRANARQSSHSSLPFWGLTPGLRPLFFFVIASERVAIQLLHYYYKAKFTGLPRSLHSLAMTKVFNFFIKKSPTWGILGTGN